MISCILIISALYSLTKGEYYIKDPRPPSYMYRKFENIKEEIFPQDIRINMSLSSISGTLMYSIDSHMNQFIVTLYDNIAPTIILEFSKQTFGISISELCLCGGCRYEWLDLRIQIRDNIYIQCNGGARQVKKYNRTKEINKAYIIPFTEKDFSTANTNEAHLWVVNNEMYNQIYPNNEQLLGCIFNILYNNQTIEFTKISANVASKCNQTCSYGICNGGQCYETFNIMPICNCTATFRNGIYCNDTMHSMNMATVSPTLKSDMFKLSWKSLSNKIFKIENSDIRIMLSRLGVELILEYDMIKNQSVEKRLLSNSYAQNNEYILVVAFHESYMNIMITDNTVWHRTTIPTNRDVRKETFTSLLLRSGNGTIDMVYKSLKEYTWRNIQILQSNKIKEEIINITSTVPTEKGGNIVTIALITVAALVLVGIGVFVYLYIKKLRRRNLPRRIPFTRECSDGSANIPQPSNARNTQSQSLPSLPVDENEEYQSITDSYDQPVTPNNEDKLIFTSLPNQEIFKRNDDLSETDSYDQPQTSMNNEGRIIYTSLPMKETLNERDRDSFDDTEAPNYGLSEEDALFTSIPMQKILKKKHDSIERLAATYVLVDDEMGLNDIENAVEMTNAIL